MPKLPINLLHMSVLSRLGLAALISGLIWASVALALSLMGAGQ